MMYIIKQRKSLNTFHDNKEYIKHHILIKILAVCITLYQ